MDDPTDTIEGVEGEWGNFEDDPEQMAGNLGFQLRKPDKVAALIGQRLPGLEALFGDEVDEDFSWVDPFAF